MSIWYDYKLCPNGLGHSGELHCHPHFEVTLLLSGDIVLYNGVYRQESRRPCLLIEKPYAFHNLRVLPGVDYERHNLYFTPDLLSRLFEQLGDPCRFFSADLTLLELEEEQAALLLFYIRRMENALEQQELCTLLLTAFLGEAAWYARSHPVHRHSTGEHYITQVLRYIEAHLGETLSLGVLAETFHIGVTKLCADFKKFTLMTVAQYIRGARIEQARRLLREGHSVLDTAMRCGYASECHFITAFRQTAGETPGQYARSYRPLLEGAEKSVPSARHLPEG